MSRGQSSIIGVALLVAVTVVALAGMTAVVGTVLEDRADAAAADRAAGAFAEALDPTGSGPGRERVALPEGQLRVVERTVRIREAGETVSVYRTNGLVYAAGERHVTYETGAIVRVGATGATVAGNRPVRAHGGELFVSLVVLGATPGNAMAADAVTLRTNTTHVQRELPAADYRIAIETDAPDAWAERLGAVGSTTRRDFDGDGVPSVVVRPGADGSIHLLVHRLRLEVSAG